MTPVDINVIHIFEMPGEGYYIRLGLADGSDEYVPAKTFEGALRWLRKYVGTR